MWQQLAGHFRNDRKETIRFVFWIGVGIAVVAPLVRFPLFFHLWIGVGIRIGVTVVTAFVCFPLLFHLWIGVRVTVVTALRIGILLPLLLHFRIGVVGRFKFHLGCTCAIV